MARRHTLLALAAAWLAITAGAGPAAAGVASRRSHRVATGESLWTIARANRCSVDQLRRANRLDGTAIQPGQRLRIPPCGAPAARSATPPRRRVAAASNRRHTETPRRRVATAIDRRHTETPPADEDGEPEEDAPIRGEDTEDAPIRGEPDEDAPIRGEDAEDDGEPVLDPRIDIPDVDAIDGVRGEVTPNPDAIGGRAQGEIIAVPLRGQSFGRPQNGYLVSGKHMPRNSAAYYLRRPERAWGADHAIDQVVRAIGQVRKRYPRVHPLAIGDFSFRHGGRISMHGSHQSGRDADIGFYFRRPPRGYPRSFAVATADNLDFPATWALISAFLRTAGQPLGVERIYMTYTTQALFYRLARKHGVPRARLDEWFQYPRGRRSAHGFIRHEPGHDEHIHVRFRCAPTDAECE